MSYSNTLKLTQRPVVDDQIDSRLLAMDNDNDVNNHHVNNVDAADTMADKKPHFLDYDVGYTKRPAQLQSLPSVPFDLIGHFDKSLRLGKVDISKTDNNDDNGLSNNSNGEEMTIAKKYERDGEISDYELAAGGYTKKEFTQDDNTLQLDVGTKKSCKHFLDENPIPPPTDIVFPKDNINNHHHRHPTESPTSINSSASRCRALNENYNAGDCGVVGGSPIIHTLKCLDHQLNFENCYTNFNADTDKLDALGQKVECVYSLLSMLGSNDPLEMAKKFYELSRNAGTCVTLRRSGCIPLLIQMIYAEGGVDDVPKWAGMALHNIIHSHPDEKAGRREAKVLRLLDQIMEYCNFLRTLLQSGGEAIADDADRHPLAAMSSLMKVSFDEEHRHAMCELGALHAIPNLVYLDHAAHSPKPESPCCNSLRRFALMALTNLTFGDENNKAFICSQKPFMEALVTQLDSTPDDLLQVTASVLRNLSWRADAQMKAILNEIGTVTALANAAMKNKCENTLKAILSALWNLSAHCSTNKAEFCAVDGALSFIVKMLNYETLKIVENAGGILRNVSSHIAVREDYRKILRKHNCLTILLQQLKSESLTVVSNSCGTLWNLSARCPQDQRFLWDNGAVPMLRSLINSKHAMIREGSACALKNLLNFRPSTPNTTQVDPIARSLNLKKLPSLNVRKQKALEQELGVSGGQILTEICDNLDTGMMTERSTYNANDVLNVATKSRPSRFPLSGPLGVIPVISGRLTRSAMLSKSESRDSIFSAKSDTAVYDHLMRSHSAAETNRKHFKTSNITAFSLKHDVELSDGQPIDYAAKYKENIIKQGGHQVVVPSSMGETSYQETDLDQPTNFSLRYAESQVDTFLEEANQIEHVTAPVSTSSTVKGAITSLQSDPGSTDQSEIILILEDSTKCYQTEDTPYIISNAPSITDLRSNPECAKKEEDCQNVVAIVNKKVDKKCNKNYAQNGSCANTYGSRSYTPEKPVNYCEEGTPGYFSRYESLSSLDEASQVNKKDVTARAPPPSDDAETERNLQAINNENKLCRDEVEVSPTPVKINSALETPLMYSRHSSIDSLAEEDIEAIDDKSSVVSEFSRLASGIISPSEIPDSPTQSMPLSPRRNHELGSRGENAYFMSGTPASSIQRSQCIEHPPESHTNTKHHYNRSVFEDVLNTFDVENTPAQFSTATSLSNLSILDEESCSHPILYTQKQKNLNINGIISENEKEEDEEEEEEEENGGRDKSDDLLLATCINIGMNRVVDTKTRATNVEAVSSSSINREITQDIIKRYCTEDTPALLSKVGSNTNLSTISIYSNNNDNTGNSNNEMNDNVIRYNVPDQSILKSCNDGTTNEIQLMPSVRHSFNLSDDMSSNASESGTGGNNFDILQQCIRDGMQKSITIGTHRQNQHQHHNDRHNDPIEKMRKGGNILPPYLTNDEMNQYHTEDTPCNFSVTSGLSNLTVGSSLVGPAIKLGSTNNNFEQRSSKIVTNNMEVRSVQDDSLSSLSIESEDDNNLLSQAIAAGCNRSKSNLGFNTIATSTGRPTTETDVHMTPTLTGAVQQHGQSQSYLQSPEQKQPWQQHRRQAEDDSDSSLHSSDSNDNHSKSLFELCILTGMHKTLDSGASKTTNNLIERHKLHKKRTVQSNSSRLCHGDLQLNTTRSNPNLKQYDSLWIDEKFKRTNRHLLEQEKRDEKLLLECINTGIMKKINESPRAKLKEQQQQQQQQLQQQTEVQLNHDDMITATLSSLSLTSSLINGQPKNGQATSVAVQKPMKKIIHPHKSSFITMDSNIVPNAIVSVTIANISNISTNTIITTTITRTTTTIPIITAAPDVEKNSSNNRSHSNGIIPATRNTQYSKINNYQTQSDNCDHKQLNLTSSSNNSVPPISHHYHHHHEGIVEDRRNSLSPSPSILSNPESTQHEISIMTDNLINTVPNTFSNVKQMDNNEMRNIIMDKHKNPDLMLKSVERLTMEFVTSAEQLRISSLSGHHADPDSHDYDCKIINDNINSVNIDSKPNKHSILMRRGFLESSPSASNSTSTWNDDVEDDDSTYPNNISFPSVSITAPKVASMSLSSASPFTQNKTYNSENDQIITTDNYREICSDLAENVCNVKFFKESKALLCQKEQIKEDIVEAADGDNEKNNSLIDKEIFSNNLTNGINFELGGEVKTAAATTSSSFQNNNHQKNNNNLVDNCMTNSIFTSQETEKLPTNFQMLSILIKTVDKDNNCNNKAYNNDDDNETEMMEFSMNSLDLDNIRPPSGMNSLNISGYYQDITLNAGNGSGCGIGLGVSDINDICNINSSQKLARNYLINQQPQHLQPKLHKKTLPIGLVARRALGHLPLHLNGSTESVLSSCNIMLENIKPPSLMDELLDSMVSVASIQSEVIDDCFSLPTTLTTVSSNLSNYETANAYVNANANVVDGNCHTAITTLENCQMTDDCTLNDAKTVSLPLHYDYSSTESTGRKSCNLDSLKSNESLTPKQKRQLAKDRFKTYTIKSDSHGQDHGQDHGQGQGNKNEDATHSQDDETLSIEILDYDDNHIDNHHYTQSELSYAEEALKISNKTNIMTRRRSSQDRYKTQTIIFPSSTIVNHKNNNIVVTTNENYDDDNENICLATLDRKFESDLSSLDCLQNSETESSHDLNINYLTNDDIKIQNNYSDEAVTTTVVKGQLNDQNEKTMENNQNVPCGKVAVENETKKRIKYISPYSKNQRNVKQTNQSNSSPIKVASMAKANDNNGKMKSIAANTINTNTKKTISMHNKGKISKDNISNGTSTYNFKRQSTFTKEKPEIINANSIPIVEISPIQSTNPSKLPTKQHQITNNSTNKHNVHVTNKQNKTITLGQKAAVTTNIIRKRPTATLNHQIKPQRANSNVTIRAKVNSNRTYALSKRISTTTPPSRSNSSMDNAATTTNTPASVSSVNASTTASTVAGVAANGKITQTLVGKMNSTQSHIVANRRNFINKSAKTALKLSSSNNNNNKSNNAIAAASTTKTDHMKRSRTFNSTEILKTPNPTLNTNTNPTIATKLITTVTATTTTTTTTKNMRLASASNVQTMKSLVGVKRKNFVIKK